MSIEHFDKEQKAKILSTILFLSKLDLKDVISEDDIHNYIKAVMPNDFAFFNGIEDAAPLLGWMTEHLTVVKNGQIEIIKVMVRHSKDDSVFAKKAKLVEYAKSIGAEESYNPLTETINYYMQQYFGTPCIGMSWVNFDFLLWKMREDNHGDDYLKLGGTPEEAVCKAMDALGYSQVIRVNYRPQKIGKTCCDRVFVQRRQNVSADYILNQMLPYFKSNSYRGIWNTSPDVEKSVLARIITGKGFTITVQRDTDGYDYDEFARQLKQLEFDNSFSKSVNQTIK